MEEIMKGLKMMRRLVVLGAAGLLLCGFAVTPEYEQQARSDVGFCVGYAKRDSPSFEATVRSVDTTTGGVRIDRVNANARGEFAFATCLMAIRKWRLVERHLPRTVDPTPPAVPGQDRYASDGSGT